MSAALPLPVASAVEGLAHACCFAASPMRGRPGRRGGHGAWLFGVLPALPYFQLRGKGASPRG